MSKPFSFCVSSASDLSPEVLDRCADALHLTMPYTPPYETFGFLRTMLVRIREQETGFGVVEKMLFDLTEWLDHAEDEYLRIFAMYLSDHPQYDCAFYAVSADRRKAEPLFRTLRLYLEGRLVEDPTFADAKYLKDHLLSCTCTAKAAEVLSGMLLRPEGKPLRSYAASERLITELRTSLALGRRRIDVCHLAEYGANPDSLLHLLFGERIVR